MFFKARVSSWVESYSSIFKHLCAIRQGRAKTASAKQMRQVKSTKIFYVGIKPLLLFPPVHSCGIVLAWEPQTPCPRALSGDPSGACAVCRHVAGRCSSLTQMACPPPIHFRPICFIVPITTTKAPFQELWESRKEGAKMQDRARGRGRLAVNGAQFCPFTEEIK